MQIFFAILSTLLLCSCSASFFNMGEPIPMQIQPPAGQLRQSRDLTMKWGEKGKEFTNFSIQRLDTVDIKLLEEGKYAVSGTVKKFNTSLTNPWGVKPDPRNLQAPGALVGESYSFTAKRYELPFGRFDGEIEGLNGLPKKLTALGMEKEGIQDFTNYLKDTIRNTWKENVNPYPIQPQKGMTLQRMVQNEVIFGGTLQYRETMKAVGKVPCGQSECLLIQVEPGLEFTAPAYEVLRSTLVYSKDLTPQQKVIWKNVVTRSTGQFLVDLRTSMTVKATLDIEVTATVQVDGTTQREFQWLTTRRYQLDQ